jgi:hypothetical protein
VTDFEVVAELLSHRLDQVRILLVTTILLVNNEILPYDDCSKLVSDDPFFFKLHALFLAFPPELRPKL